MPITDSPNTIAHPIQTAGLPVGAGIPLITKEKVWNHEYVDLHDLMENNTYIYVLQLQHPVHLSYILHPVKGNNYSRKWNGFPHSTHTMHSTWKSTHMNSTPYSYSSTVQQILTAGGDWRNYDICYRQDQGVTYLSWHTVRPDLQYRLTGAQTYSRFCSQQKTPSKDPPTRGRPRPHMVTVSPSITLKQSALGHPAHTNTHATHATADTPLLNVPEPVTNRTSPIHPERLCKLLEAYHDSKYLTEGFLNGFKLDFERPEWPLTS